MSAHPTANTEIPDAPEKPSLPPASLLGTVPRAAFTDGGMTHVIGLAAVENDDNNQRAANENLRLPLCDGIIVFVACTGP